MYRKLRSAQCAAREIVAVVCFVRELDAFALADEADGVFADHVATAQRVYTKDLAHRSRAHHATAPVRGLFGVTQSKRLRNAFGEVHRGTAWAVFLIVMYLGDLDVVVSPSIAATSLVILNNTFTPTLMFGAFSIAILFASVLESAFCASFNPVVPTTTAANVPQRLSHFPRTLPPP